MRPRTLEKAFSASFYAKNEFKCFSVQYRNEYRYLLSNLIAADTTHPLHIKAKRARRDKEKSGLWWWACVNSNTAATSVVRHWCRRRLINAFVEELNKRGFDGDGKEILKRKNSRKGLDDASENILGKEGQIMRQLTGSLRLNSNPGLVTAKFEEIKREAALVIDVLVNNLEGKGSPVPSTGPRVPHLRKSALEPQRSGVSRKALPFTSFR